MPRAVLIVEDDPRTAGDLQRFLEPEFPCVVARNAAEAAARAREGEIAAALVDLDLGRGPDGFDVIRELRRIDPRTAILVVTGDTTEEALRRARDLDVDDFIRKSIGIEELRRAVRTSLLLRGAAERARRAEEERAAGAALLVAESPAMRRALEEVRRAARHMAPVLIVGPVGSGKMVVAREIHAMSRPGKPFEVAHCARWDTEIADIQLFGSEPGAFTGATRTVGAFERAGDGTLVLDDIDYLPLRVQAKLLQPLEERVVRRLPGTVEVPVRCRVLVTTNKDLGALERAGAFRDDLHSRLRGAAVIAVPGIAERREDLPRLVERLALEAAREDGRRLGPIGARFVEAVLARRWADVRALRNAIRYAVGVSEDGALEAENLPAEGTVGGEGGAAEAGRPATSPPAPAELLDGPLREVLDRVRLAAVRRALEAEGGDKPRAARRLGITVQGLNRILREGGGSD